MCYAAMQTQAAKSKFGTLYFKARNQVDMDEKMIYPLGTMAFGRLGAEGEREYLAGQFGLVPSWVTDDQGATKFGRYCYNARAETIFQKPSFKSAILRHRAVIPVTAFFEFPDNEKPLQHRYRISRQDGQPFWFAGIWEFNKRYNLSSCSIITTEPMDLVKQFHSRSPVILDDDQVATWLNPNIDQPEPIGSFLKPHTSAEFVLEQEAWKGKKG